MKSVPKAAWMIIPTYFPVVGGAQVQVRQLSQSLASQGWAVTILTRQHSYAHPQGLSSSEIIAGTPVRRLNSQGGKSGSLRFILSGLGYFLRNGRRGIYHAHDIGAAGWLAVLARFLFGGRSLVKLRTGTVAYKESLRSRWARWQFHAMLRLADQVIVVNREVQAYLQALGIPAERVVWIPNGVDIERFYPASPIQKSQARAQLGIGAAERVVLYVGRLEHMKGVDILLRGWKELRQLQREHCRLILVGDGPERETLAQMARNFGVDASVCFAGEQDSVNAYYRAADLFVLPSRTEGLSNALLEGMASGLPVLVSKVGGAVDLVQEGQSGFFFESEDALGLAGCLEMLLSQPDDRLRRMGEHARASVVASASLETTVRRTEMIYQQLTESMRRTRAGV